MFSELSSLTRSKLSSSTSKESCSLHRWVLLKNSITRAPPSSPITPQSDQPELPHDADEDDLEESDAFMFPDVAKFGPVAESNAAEAQWLDSLLETLGDDDDDDFNVGHLPADDDDDHLLLSPLPSPMSSSDDLVSQTYFHSPVPYIPTYPFRPQLMLPYHPLPNDPLPYYDLEEDDDVPPVPDAIDDTSDDESETPPTPSLRGSSSSLSLPDPASVPLPAERSRLGWAQPHIYVDGEDDYYSPFELHPELDPLPFPERNPFNTYHQEC